MTSPGLTIDVDHAAADEGIVTARLAGEIDTATGPGLLGQLQALIFTGAPRELVLDFTDVTFVDSSGLRVLIDVHKQLRDHGAKLVLEQLAPAPRQVLEITGLTDYLELR